MSDTPIGFTVKEILTEIVIPDLKAIKASMEDKADRSEVLAVQLQVRDHEGKLGRIPFEYRQEIATALESYDTRAQSKAERQFSRRDKLLLGSLGVVTALAAVVSTIVMVLSASAGGGS